MIPRCPKCGEPPRSRVGIFKAREYLTREGDELLPTGKFRLIAPASPVFAYRCGGEHEWEAREEQEEG